MQKSVTNQRGAAANLPLCSQNWHFDTGGPRPYCSCAGLAGSARSSKAA